MDKGLVFDLKIFSAEDRIRRNLLGIRSSVSQENGLIDQQSFTLIQGQTLSIPNLPLSVYFSLYANRLVSVLGKLPGQENAILFPPQSLFLLEGGLRDVEITNNNTENVTVTITRLSRTQVVYINELTLFTFPAFARIIPLGFVVQDINKMVVQTQSFISLTNDQVSAPSTNQINKYKIVDSDGTPNINGDHLMYLDDNITQNNSSGTLQLWIGQLA